MIIQPLLVLAVGVCAGVLLAPLLERIVPRAGPALFGWRRRRRALRAAANAELRARTTMSELCPHGWRAQIVLFEHAELEDDPESGSAPNPARVKLEWTELRDATGTPAVMRQVWAPTIRGALDAMVADRRTDETLEQIEQGAVADGARWPDPD
ncbi:MAG: hypothetical protein ACRDNK_22960 [Solirubrobacteraceae bacterium]